MNEKHEQINEKQDLKELTNETPHCQELDDDALENTSGGWSHYTTCPRCQKIKFYGSQCLACGYTCRWI